MSPFSVQIAFSHMTERPCPDSWIRLQYFNVAGLPQVVPPFSERLYSIQPSPVCPIYGDIDAEWGALMSSRRLTVGLSVAVDRTSSSLQVARRRARSAVRW